MLGHLEQIEDTQKSRRARQLRSDIGQADRLNRVDFDFAFLHAVTGADPHMGTRPYAYAAGDLSAPHSIAQPLGEHHAKKSTTGAGGHPQSLSRVFRCMKVVGIEEECEICGLFLWARWRCARFNPAVTWP